jgi:hypothetical protein
MVYWETAASGDDPSAAFRDYARIWRAADKVVYSSTLDAVNSARTRLERTFDPDAVRRLKSASSISTPSWWAVGHEPCPPVCASSWSCWTSAASATAWSTCATGSASPSLMV